MFSLWFNGSAWGYNSDFMFILMHKITENHLTLTDNEVFLPDDEYFFSSNMVVTFFELYYCMYSIQRRYLIRQMLEIAASHYPWRSISKIFLTLSWLEWKNVWKHSFVGNDHYFYPVLRYPGKRTVKNISTHLLLHT